MLKRALEDHRAAKDNHVGPGHYEVNTAATMKKSPSARFTTASLPGVAKGPIDGLADIVSGTGNMAERVNAARGKIKEYLGQAPSTSQPGDLTLTGKGNQGSRAHLELGKDSLSSARNVGGNYARSVTNKQASKISLLGAGGAGGSAVAPGPGGGAVTSPNNNSGASLQPSASFLSGVKRTDLSK